MTVFVFDNAPNALRGELSRWFLELKPGVFVGKVNRGVSDRLWERFCTMGTSGGIRVQSYPNEQGFALDLFGSPKRKVVDYEGIQLVSRDLAMEVSCSADTYTEEDCLDEYI